MPTKYPKTENLFRRDPDTHKLINEFRLQEFEIIDRWLVTEKIDGTNIRVSLIDKNEGVGDEKLYSHVPDWDILIQGRGDNAQIPPQLMKHLQETFTLEKMLDVCEDGPYPFTLFGEGYGAGIQKGGNLYRPDTSFRVFDVLVGEKWLDFENIEDIADKLEIKTVPLLTCCKTVDEIVECVKSDPMSQVASEEWLMPDNDQEVRKQEGIVAFTNPALFGWWGGRIKFKLKKVDFPDA